MNLLREHPYRLLMPLAIVATWIGVGQWLLHLLGWVSDYQPVLHALAQTEGFLASFVAAFLLTMLPKRCGTASPAPAFVIGIALLLTATLALVMLGKVAASQSLWMVLLGLLLWFVVTRTRHAKRTLPDTFTWLPVALLFGLTGGVLAGVGGIWAKDLWWLHRFGRGIGLEGMFLAIVIGVGRLVFTVMTHGEGSAKRVSKLAHAAGMALLGLSFLVEVRLSQPFGLALRGVVVAALLWSTGELHRLPSKSGVNRWAIWLAAWMLPLGYLTAALFVEQWRAGLHMVFIGGFAYLVLSVGAQVQLGHGGHEALKNGRPWWMFAIGGGLGLALAARMLMEFDPVRFFVWMGVASGFYVAATGLWAAQVALRPAQPSLEGA